MKRVRDHDQQVYFRANRFHRSNSHWYFVTREDTDVGPFESKELAEAELAHYLGEIPHLRRTPDPIEHYLRPAIGD
jgi:hypothetical protein